VNKLGPAITVVIAIVLIVIIAWQTGKSGRPPETQPGGAATAAPAVGGKTLAGQRWNLQDQRGKVVLLDFWATWCPPCVGSIPGIKTIHEKFKGNSDFLLVGVSEDDEKSDLQSFIQKNGVAWLQVYDLDSKKEMARAFGVHEIPATFLIDRQGNFRKVELGPEELIAEIERLLKATS
jgi:peroxiredoxin